ncbi:MAG: DUF6259 domain-containing protein [Terriglobia bacterium]
MTSIRVKITRPELVLAFCTLAVALTTGGCAGRKTYSRALDGISVVSGPKPGVQIRSRNIILKFSPQQALSVAMVSDGVETSLAAAPAHDAAPSSSVTVAGKEVTHFTIDYSRISIQRLQTPLGNCDEVQIPSHSEAPHIDLNKTLSIDLCPAFPASAIFTTTYTNRGTTPLKIDRVFQLVQTIEFPRKPPRDLWTFEGASVRWGRDFIFPLPSTFEEQNPEGQMLRGGTGGGIPVNDFWLAKMGLAIGHIQTKSARCWMPVETLAGGRIRISIETRPGKTLAQGEAFKTLRTFVTVHHGDFYNALSTYSSMLRAEGVSFMKSSSDLYDPFWYTYGYGHNLRAAQVYQTVPMLKKLGIKWIMVNNRWWDHYGDWMPREDKFGGVAGFKRFVARMHREGFKVLVWWMPCAVQLAQLPRSGLYESPVGAPKQTAYEETIETATAAVAKQHPDWLIEDKQGKPIPIARNLAALCPAYPPARNYIFQLAKRMIKDWKVDGFYLDVSYIIPSCYNPAHHHSSHYDSVEQMAGLFRGIRSVVEQYNPNGMVMICPCGTTPNFCLLPDENEPLPADPVGSQQVRWRIKMYKALFGSRAPVFADRVSSTYIVPRSHDEAGSDFASAMGTGGILGAMFNWPKPNMLPGDVEYTGGPRQAELLCLTPAKVAHWEKWFDLYHQKMLSDGEFLNLYTLGFADPEGYAIRKGSDMYYAFFVSQPRAWGIDRPPILPKPKNMTWEGRIELKGLDPSNTYRVVDYVHGKTLGTISGSSPYLKTKFINHLLIEAIPDS